MLLCRHWGAVLKPK